MNFEEENAIKSDRTHNNSTVNFDLIESRIILL